VIVSALSLVSQRGRLATFEILGDVLSRHNLCRRIIQTQQSIEEFGIFIESDVAAFEPNGGLYFR
jgi:hypothetical protein